MKACPSCGTPAADDARFCANCGTPLEPAGGEERKLATIVFADVIGSTDLGEQLDPERLRALLAEYFAQMAQVIGTWGGTVEKYIGDAIVAVFGVPTAREDDAVRALSAALEMITQLETLNAGLRGAPRRAPWRPHRREHRRSPRTDFGARRRPVHRVGRSGQRGGAARTGGRPVARCWSASARGRRRARPSNSASRSPLTLKGKREPVIARSLGKPITAEQRGVRFQAPMIGRDRELATLLGLLDEAVESGSARPRRDRRPGRHRQEPAAARVRGARRPTMPTSRSCAAAVSRRDAASPSGRSARSCVPPVASHSTNRATSAAQKLVATVDPLLAPLNLSQAERDETVFALATSAGLAVAGNVLASVEPERVGEATARAWPRFVTALGPAFAGDSIVEDLHWADERMVAMLEAITARSVGPVLILATARPEFLESHPGLGRRRPQHRFAETAQRCPEHPPRGRATGRQRSTAGAGGRCHAEGRRQPVLPRGDPAAADRRGRDPPRGGPLAGHRSCLTSHAA